MSVAPADRAVLSDDNQVIRLTSYTGRTALAVVEISPLRAAQLARELLTVALRCGRLQ